MTEIMTPSTEEQINKAVGNYRALLEKHSKTFDKKAVQTVLGQSELAEEQFNVFRRRVEVISNTIVRKVRVNRNRTPQEVLDATDREQYTDESVVEIMPKGEGEEAEVIFFKPRLESFKNGWVSDDELEEEFEFMGLKPADPYSLATVNEADPAFADEHPNATHWKDADGKWCYSAFNRRRVERRVRVGRYGHAWDDSWWFAGLRKEYSELRT